MRNICIAIAMFVSCSACNDWLDVKPKGELEREVLFSDYAGFKDALTGCYMSMCSPDVYGQMLTMQLPDLMAQLWMFDNTTGAFRDITDFDYSSKNSQDMFQSIWGGLYRVIVQANVIIEKVEANADVFPSESERAMVEAEARAIRACCHLDVLRLFGQMPQGGGKAVKLPYTEDVSREAKTYYSYEEFCGKLEADLERAATLLKEHDIVCEGDNWITRGLNNVLVDKLLTKRDLHFNYFAVKALQARYYLYVGKNAEAYAAAKEIIEHKHAGKLADESDYKAGFYTKPSDALFRLNRSDWDYSSNKVVFGSALDRDDAPMYVSMEHLAELYPDYVDDIRYQRLFSFTKMNLQYSQQPILRKYYHDENQLPNPGEEILMYKIRVIPILRVSEIYLIAMETSQELNEINQLYHDYMAHRGILKSESHFNNREEVRQEVINEYRREFYGEGQMFFVYKRTGAVTMKWGKGNVGENQYIVPVPLTEYSAN